MGRLLDLLKGVEISIRSRLGMWMQEVSVAGDQIPSMQADIAQLQVDVTSPGGAYVTQAMWYVNSVTGNDANDGASEGTAIKTLNELGRRFYARSFPQNTTVQLRGTFPTERLVIDCHVLSGFLLTVNGDTPTVNYSGTIGTYSALVQGVSAGQMTDAGRDFVADAQRRCRITSGARVDTHWWILKDLTGNTSRISQPLISNGTTLQVPAASDPYNIETLVTVVGGHSIYLRGGGACVVRDCKFSQPAGNGTVQEAYCEASPASIPQRITFFGCWFDSSTTYPMRGTPILQACAFTGSSAFTPAGPSILLCRGNASFSRWSIVQSGGEVIFQANCVWQSVNASSVGVLSLDQNTFVFAFGGTVAFFDCTSTTAVLTIGTRSGFEVQTPNVLWGINNTAPYGVKVTTTGTLLYGAAAPPTLTGNVVGQDTLVGNTPVTWAAIQAATGVMNSSNGALIAQRL